MLTSQGSGQAASGQPSPYHFTRGSSQWFSFVEREEIPLAPPPSDWKGVDLQVVLRRVGLLLQKELVLIVDAGGLG